VVSVPLGGAAVRVTLTLWEMLEVASAAVTVMVLTPIVSGIFEMAQIVPVITDPSNAPIPFVQLIAGAPLPPVTVPDSDIDVAVVVAGGTLIVRAIGVAVRITLTTRETFPLGSAAVTVMLLSPIASGTLDATQLDEPLIEDPPDRPVPVVQVTEGAPVPPVTVPESGIVAAVVVAGGASIVKASGPAIRITLTVLETLPVESAAVTVMRLEPTLNGIVNMLQFASLTDALSAAPVFDNHVTTGVPLPPVTLPDSEIAAEIVAEGGVLIVRASETDGGAVRVTLTVLAMGPSASVAVIVMLFGPMISGIFEATQFPLLSEALPDVPALEVHVTATAPVPPVAVPKSTIEEDEVVSGAVLTVRVKVPGTTGGVTVPV
jgi:hypothetical protein